MRSKDLQNQIDAIEREEKDNAKLQQEVNALNSSVDLSNELFRSARANYLEGLMAQRDALAAKLELVESKKNQLMSITNMYKVLGGGWK